MVVLEHQVTLRQVDAVQIYFTTYLDWANEAFEALLVKLEHPAPAERLEGFAAPIVHLEVDYLRPLTWGERAQQTCWVDHVGGSSIWTVHRFVGEAGVVCEARSVRAWTSISEGRAVSVPSWLREATGYIPGGT